MWRSRHAANVLSEWRVKLPEKPLDVKYFGNLKSRVIDTGICSRCLTCAAVCPAPEGITAIDGVVFENWEEKCLDCGACVRVCPRFEYVPKSGVGDYIDIIAARSKRFKGQDGAMVTEIIASAIEMDIIDRAIFVGRDEEWRTTNFHLRDTEQLSLKTLSGTKYCYSNALSELRDAVLMSEKGVGVVGTPCMVSGVRNLREQYPVFRKVKLSIGLFCTENFHWHELHEFLSKKGVSFEKLIKTDITKGQFIATMTDGEVSFPVKDLEEIIPSGCHVCTDFTAVDADASVGSVGSAPGFSTVIVRSAIVKDIIRYIKQNNYAEFGDVMLKVVQKMVKLKKKREAHLKK
ncbi:MAG: Coenzyme F420 hydrogenase/dehydrogenase, beta subunit C-terminal domain [Canidatus Methanoxibalbensis ujae]|nr:Coenzyme F420 hydrogenase/dehydrogenase, beta subunit C-terminal domain [Candidatus Methanoxibalbensis ujae]MCW7079106.1 Coenzyme F420 hydrogenase/dehydrogenase, beta subunit C-terminal domain [Candidatus Methanoxibalbensis ujae]